MEFQDTDLAGVYIIKPDIFTDFRGDNVVAWNKKTYPILPDAEFVEHNLFSAFKGCLVGLHYSPTCWKMYQVVHGKAFYVLVIADEKHSDYGKSQSFILTDTNHYQLIKPPHCASAFLCLSDTMTVLVYQSEFYNKEKPNQVTYRYDDKGFNLWFPQIVPEPILSRRDEAGKYIATESKE